MSRSSEAAMRPREPCTTNTLGNPNPRAASQRCGLYLRGAAGALRPLRKENYFPPSFGCDLCEARDGARLDLLERLPEVFDRFNVCPQPTLLPGRHPQLQDGGRIFDRFVGWFGGRVGRRDARGRCRDAFAKQQPGLAHQLRFHVGENAVQIECDAEIHE